MAPTEPHRAETIAHTIAQAAQRDQALLAVVQAVAPTEPHRAETIAHTITSSPAHADGLQSIIPHINPMQRPRLIAQCLGLTHWARSASNLRSRAAAAFEEAVLELGT